jgi:hypothetical protein
MEQREYKIIIHSVSRFIIGFIVILISSLILINKFTPKIENEFLYIIQFIAIFISSVYLAQLMGKARIKVLFTEEGFIHIWERRFLFSWEKNLKIPWDKIDNYVFQEDRKFDSFIINLTFKKRYKINRLNFIPINDDFEKLLNDFPSLSNKFREGKVSDEKFKIKEGKTIYEGWAFKWAFVFMVIGFIFMLAEKLSNPESTTSWSSIGVVGSGVFFYRAMILKKNKK